MTATVKRPTVVPLDDLHTYYQNPRRGDVAAIAASLQAHGQYKPIVVNVGTHTGRPAEVVAGNHTLMAFRDLREANTEDPRWREVLVHWIDVDNDRAARIVVADNRTSELGWSDLPTLAALLESFDGDLTGLGYTEEDLASLITSGDDKDSPNDFPSYDNDISTEYRCPKCNYEWSGKPK